MTTNLSHVGDNVMRFSVNDREYLNFYILTSDRSITSCPGTGGCIRSLYPVATEAIGTAVTFELVTFCNRRNSLKLISTRFGWVEIL